MAQISGEYLQLLEREKNLRGQLALIEEKRKNLIVRSPIDGQVLLPWDAEQSLKHRPVVTGQRVLTVADPSGDWELELAMPERRMGHVRKAIDEFGPDLEVSYVSAADPRSPKYGTLKKVYGITQVKGEEGPTVKMTVRHRSRRTYSSQVRARLSRPRSSADAAPWDTAGSTKRSSGCRNTFSSDTMAVDSTAVVIRAKRVSRGGRQIDD